jgi:hypothetical protein
MRTTGREGIGRFGIWFWVIMGRGDWFGNVRLLFAIRFGYRKRFSPSSGWFR